MMCEITMGYTCNIHVQKKIVTRFNSLALKINGQIKKKVN